jgi:uncharacterized protein (TIGR03067 family)
MLELSRFLTFFILLLTCYCVVAGDADDAKKLQGDWTLTELVVGGAKLPDKEIAGMKFVFAGDKLTISPPTADTGVVDKRSFTFKLDPVKQPARVEVTALDGEHKGVVSPGIYEIKGDTLRWCQSDDPKSKEIPKDFVSPEKSTVYVFTFKRAK